MTRGSRIPLSSAFLRPPAPSLTLDEVVAIHDILAERLGCIRDEISRHRVSESVVRERMAIEDVLPEFRAVMESRDYKTAATAKDEKQEAALALPPDRASKPGKRATSSSDSA